MNQVLTCLICAVALQACQTTSNLGSYDEYPLVVATLDLFNQTIEPRSKKIRWSGDWVFRRERLAQINAELKSIKPDVILFQETMRRRENPNEADLKILSADALSGYAADFSKSREIPETDEVEGLGFAVNRPLQLKLSELKDDQVQRHWNIGDNTDIAMNVVQTMDASPLLVFNIQTPENQKVTETVFRFLGNLIKEKIVEQKTCIDRILIGGRIETSMDEASAKKFFEDLRLKDTAEGFCQNAARCVTASPQNELFLLTHGEAIPRHVDRLLVPRTAYVYSASRFLADSADSKLFSSLFLNGKLPPSVRMGWTSTVRFSQCEKP